MAEYIEKEAVLLEITERIAHIAFTSPYQREIEAIVVGMERARDSVEDAPAADVVPVVHGRWERCGRYLCECQDCGEIYSTHENLGKGWNYCPNCGAKMDGE